MLKEAVMCRKEEISFTVVKTFIFYINSYVYNEVYNLVVVVSVVSIYF